MKYKTYDPERVYYNVLHTLNILGDCAHLLDEEYQERVWINGEGPEVDSFEFTTDELYYAIEACVVKEEGAEFSLKQQQLMKEFYVYLEEIDIELEGGKQRGGRNDQAPDIIKLKSIAKELVSELAKFLLESWAQESYKKYADDHGALLWAEVVNIPLCGYTPEQKKQLLSLFD